MYILSQKPLTKTWVNFFLASILHDFLAPFLLLQFLMKYFSLFYIITSPIISQISKLNFNYCWWFDIFYYPTFL